MANYSNPIIRLIQSIYYKITGYFPGTTSYWEKRYQTGGTSGKGSYGEVAQYKANVINSFILEHDIQSVIEFGCGDGNQLSLLNVKQYLGFDVSETALEMCKLKFKNDPTKSFKHTNDFKNEKAELTLSVEVIFHLFEDDIYQQYMERLFSSATKYVLIYSSNTNKTSLFEGIHVKHRKFTDWIEKNHSEWVLIHNPCVSQNLIIKPLSSFSNFFFYQKENE